MLNTLTHRFLWLVAFFALAAAPAPAQFELEGEDAPADEPAAAEAAPAEAPANAAELADFARRDPVVAAALDLPRDSAAQKLKVVLALIDLGRTDVAAAILPELLAMELDDAARAALVGEFGAARFLQLSRLDSPGAGETPSELPGAREFAQQCLDAAAAEAHDPARITAIIEGLNAPAEQDRYAARVDLRGLGEPGLVAALEALAKATTPEARGNLMAGLAELRPALDAPLIAILAEGRGQLRADAATLAGKARLKAALPYLAALSVSTVDPAAAAAARQAMTDLGLSVPTPAQVQTLLRDQLAAIDAAPLSADAGIRETWWSWDAAQNAPVAAGFTQRKRHILARARLARALSEAGGDANAGDRQLTMIDSLEAAALVGGSLPADVAKRVAAASPAELSAMLASAVDQERFAAASRLAAELGARGDAGVLATPDGRPSPLAAALTSPVRDLRFAALAAVMQLNPGHTFPGASYVPASLWYFAAGGGDPTAVVAAPGLPRATDWAGQLRRLGYDATPAATGRGALVAAFDPVIAPRLAIVLLDGDIGQPLVREVVYQLRSADRTAQVPIIIGASPEHLPYAQRIAADDPLVLAAPRPRGELVFDELVQRALALSTQPLADRAERTQQAARALDWIATLIAAGAPYDEMRRDGSLVLRTLFIPELTEPSIRVFGALGTSDSQAALMDYASSPSAPIESRRLASQVLHASFAKFGVQLTREQILRQYDRYNASETADADTQQVLGNILDALEKQK